MQEPGMTLAETAARDVLDDKVDCRTLADGQPPLFVTAREGACAGLDDALAWLARHRPALDTLIERHGGVVLPHMKHHGQNLVEVAFPLCWVAAGAMAKDVSGRKDAFNTLLNAARRVRLFRP